jgi:hypothetical protein
VRPQLILVLASAAALASATAVGAPLPVAPVGTLPEQVVVPDDAPDGAFFDPTAVAPAVGVKGENPPIAYIVNGSEVPEGQYPEVVFIEMTSSTATGGGESTCTGSLIDPEWILTAGHCVAHDDKTELASAITVKFGSVGSSPDKTIEADRWFAHPDWDPQKSQSNGFKGDVALVHLSERVEDVFVMALNESAMDNSWLDSDLTFVGFGITKGGGTGSGVKRVVDVPIVNVPTDRPWLVQNTDGEHGTCQGDSGGPGLRKVSGGYVQASVTSHGEEGCLGRSGHMRVDYYLDWIKAQVATTGGTVQTTPAAPPTFVCSRQVDPEDPLTTSIGVVPFDLVCALVYNNFDELTKVTWSWGDGKRDETDDPQPHAVHRYTDAGLFTIDMCVEGQRNGSEPWEHCVQRSSLVRSCDLAEVEFHVEQDDGLTYKFLNYTNLRTSYGCVFNVEWDIFAGSDTSGEPIDKVASWEPVYTFEEPGEYTVVLNVGGIAGTAAAKATFTAKATGGAKSRCDQTGLPAGALLGLVAMAAVRRRRS